MDVELDIRYRLGRGNLHEASDRLFVLLQTIDECGSLSQACDQLDLSYRTAWGMIKDWAKYLGNPLVSMQRGRGTELTELGQALLEVNRYTRSTLKPELEQIQRKIQQTLEQAHQKSGGTLTIFASHSLAQDILRSLLQRQTGLRIQLQNAGSLESLKCLQEKQCDVAGFHIAEDVLRKRLIPQYTHWLNQDKHRLIRVATRRQGLMLLADNPKRILDLNSLTNPDIRFVNRQKNSGTRALLNALLQSQDIDTARISGYDQAEFTHSAVAALVASGAADVGFGVEAAAVQFKLKFIPLASEVYYFAFETNDQDNPAIQHLISTIASSEFRTQTNQLTGYNTRHSGQLETVSELLK